MGKNVRILVRLSDESGAWMSVIWMVTVLRDSAARKIDKKVANLLLKVAQKVATLKNQFKTALNRFLKVKFLDFILELVLNMY